MTKRSRIAAGVVFAVWLGATASAAPNASSRPGFGTKGSAAIFFDGFETGDTLRWSSQQGDPGGIDLPPR